MAYDLTDEQFIGQIIDGTVTEIGNTEAGIIVPSKLAGCTLLTIVILPSVTVVGAYAFAGCTSLNNVMLDSCTRGGEHAFQGCTALANIELPLLSLPPYFFQGCTALVNVNLPFCQTIEEDGFYGCGGSGFTSLSLPEVTALQTYAFANISDSLASISLPKCTTVGERAFYYANITSISLPLCTTVGDYAFQGCDALQTVDLPLCQTVGVSAFQDLRTALTSVNIPACVTISNNAFMACCNLTQITATNAVNVGDYAFFGCNNLLTISLPKCVALNNVNFLNCKSLTTVDLPVCETIGSSCFNGCEALTSISIPKVKTIADGAFVSCKALPSIYLSSNINTIGSCFDGCIALTDIYIDLPPDSVLGSPWGATNASLTVHWRAVLSVAPVSINISMQKKSLTDTITAVFASEMVVGTMRQLTVLGETFPCRIDSSSYNRNTGLYTVSGRYPYAVALDNDATLEYSSGDESADSLIRGAIGSMANTNCSTLMDGWTPTGVLSKKSANTYQAINSVANIVRAVIGWTDIVPTLTVNLALNRSAFPTAIQIIAVQRGHETATAVTITRAELERGTYTAEKSEVRLLASSDQTYYLMGDTNGTEDGSTDAAKPTSYISGIYHDNSNQQTLTYSYGLLKTENFTSTDGTIVADTVYTYSTIYPPANMLRKETTRTETKSTADVPAVSDITSFPYKVTEKIVNVDTLVNAMALNGTDLIQTTETVSSVSSGYNITDNTGATTPWTETESHETITYYSDMGQGQWSVISYKDGLVANSQIVTSNPGAQASPYAIKTKSTYASKRGGKVTSKKAELAGKFLGAAAIPVADQETLDSVASAIAALNGKTQETIRGTYIGGSVLDFTKKIFFDGNEFFLDSNNISVTPERGTRQNFVMVRWY